MTKHFPEAAGDLLQRVGDRSFHTVLADPPWQFQNRTGKMAPEHKRLNRYATMTLDDILALPVASIVGDTAHLYLWVPNALLPEGLRVLAAWGFDSTRATSSGTRSARTVARTGAASASTSATPPN
jgi:N6-adenosine-specific RNA methylase IME4